jgi:hypothetical protein
MADKSNGWRKHTVSQSFQIEFGLSIRFSVAKWISGSSLAEEGLSPSVVEETKKHLFNVITGWR